MLSQLSAFISTPHKFIQEAQFADIRKLSLLSIVIAALSSQVQVSTSFTQLLLGTIFGALGIAFILFIQSVTQDFIAQALNLKPQSLSLFYWLGLSFLPYALFLPLSVLSQVGTLGIIAELAKFGIIIWTCILQIQILKSRYSTSTLISTVIYIFPVIFIIAISLLLLILSAILA